MNSLSANEVIEVLGEKARSKGRLDAIRTVLLGVLAGAFIALGYLAFIRISGTAPKEWGSFSTFLGGCLFPIGLIAIVLLGGELVTGNMMVMSFGFLEKKSSAKEVLRNWLLALIGNALGGLLIAYAFGHVVGLTEGAFAAKTTATALGKLADTPLKQVVSGIGCNIFVCMAVFFATMSKDYLGKIVGAWMPIMLFVVCGFQHVVANTFILPAGLFAGAEYTIFDVLKNLFFVFIGNAIGGSLFLAVPVYYANKTK